MRTTRAARSPPHWHCDRGPAAGRSAGSGSGDARRRPGGSARGPRRGRPTFRLKPVPIPEFEFVNLYGTDVTAEKAIDKFPNQNPNSGPPPDPGGPDDLCESGERPRPEGARGGGRRRAEPAIFGRILAAEGPPDPTMEVEAEGTIYRIRVVSVYEFDSINLYGTDITAARQVETLNAENETLLLNILPRSIAERLRGGEMVIADRFEDMAVLFADVVGFTELSSRLSANEVVSLLNDVFSACDRLADRFRLEKIKTIGDAYMVAGGLQTVMASSRRRTDHASTSPRWASRSSTRSSARAGARAAPPDPGRDARRARRRRRHRAQEVHLRRLGRHGEHGQPDGVDRRAGPGPGDAETYERLPTASTSSAAGQSR